VEDAASSVTQFLVRLIFPAAIVGGLAGLGLMLSAIIPLMRDSPARSATSTVPPTGGTFISERISVGICACLSLFGLVALIFNVARGVRPPTKWSALLVALLIVLGVPALCWRSRWRIFAEGVATIALAGVSFLTGFSIGSVFVPLLAVMIWVCAHHLFLASIHTPANAGRSG
jgi:tetrahydromethanopterin S-methyltransferase subunit B